MTKLEKWPETNPGNPGTPKRPKSRHACGWCGAARCAVNHYPSLSVPVGMDYETFITNRLARWAIWRMWLEGLLNTNPAPRRVCSWWGPIWMARTKNAGALPPKPFATCPVDEIEAIETDRCYQVLMERDKDREVKYHRVIVLCYLTNFTYKERAAAMQPPGHFSTFWRRLNRAHAELLSILDEVATGAIDFPDRGLSESRARVGNPSARMLTPMQSRA